MIILHPGFWVAFAVFLLLFHRLPVPARNVPLFAANLLFLGLCGRWLPVLHLLGGSAIFFLAQITAHSSTLWRRRFFLACGIALVVGGLLGYRYWLAAGEQRFIGAVGLSFTALQALGYLISVYRKHPPAPSLFQFLLFLSFFPIVLMGPIERWDRLGPQLAQKKMTRSHWQSGCNLILLGFLKKKAFADPLWNFTSSPTPSFADLHGLGLWAFAILCYAQVYFDFSGYTDIARGMAKLLGFDVIPGFYQPYLARNVGDLWRRWNSSLTQWLTEYVYLPLLLSLRNPYFSSFLAILTIGFWHQLSWLFFLWSLYWTAANWIHLKFQSLSIVKKIWRRATSRPASKRGLVISSILLTQMVTAFSTLVFMSVNVRDLIHTALRCFDFFPGFGFMSLAARLQQTVQHQTSIWLAGLAVIAVEIAYPPERTVSRSWSWALTLFLLFAIAGLISGEAHEFIYLRY